MNKSSKNNSFQRKEETKIKKMVIEEIKQKFSEGFKEKPNSYIKKFKAEITVKRDISNFP